MIATDLTYQVAHSTELERILAIPRRVWRESDPEVMRLTFEMSAWARLPGSTVTLFPAQAVALAELSYYRCLLAPLPVGAGKTLISFLAATIFVGQRPLLVIPGKLRRKTENEFKRLAKDWRSPKTLRIVSYEQLSKDYGDDEQKDVNGIPRGILDLTRPDLIISDEVHRMKNVRASCTRKMNRYMEAHPETVRVDLSGTFTNKSIMDYAHIARWNLKAMCPVPRNYHEIREWGNGIDAEVREGARIEVGALLALATEDERRNNDPLTAARLGYRRRFIETPGVVSFGGEYLGSSLLVRELEMPDYSSETEDAFENLRERSELPDGSTTSGGIDDWRHARTLARGFYRIWDPQPPEPWRLARSAWSKAVRDCIRYGDSHGIDSEFQVANACRRRLYRTETWEKAQVAYEKWIEIRGSFLINEVTIWLKDATIFKAIKDWAKDNIGIIWIDHIDLAEELSRRTKFPYFHEKGMCGRKLIDDCDPKIDGPIIASIESNRDGRNLQKYSSNLFVSLPKGADAMQQALGRTHRNGQIADEVQADIMILTREDAEQWQKIMNRSKYIVDSSPLGAKVLTCDLDMPSPEEIELRGKETWRFA